MGDYFSDPIGISETSQSCRSKDYSIHLSFVKLPQTRIDVTTQIYDFRSGRAAKSWALRRRLEVPRTAPCGSVSIEAYLLLTKASPALARLVTAVRHRPSGRTVGISFRLWTARSISPSRRAVSSSLVKVPCRRF